MNKAEEYIHVPCSRQYLANFCQVGEFCLLGVKVELCCLPESAGSALCGALGKKYCCAACQVHCIYLTAYMLWKQR